MATFLALMRQLENGPCLFRTRPPENTLGVKAMRANERRQTAPNIRFGHPTWPVVLPTTW